MASKAALQQAAAYNVTADRVLGVLEAIVFGPATSRRVADSIGAHPRTVQRIVRTLERAQYVERLRGRGSVAHTFHPTVRLLAMAAQLAPRLPPVQRGDDVVDRLEAATEFGAYVAVPSYTHVVIIACSGRRGIRPWALLPALDDAAGRMLLAHRREWRASVLRDPRDMSEAEISRTLRLRQALIESSEAGASSIAVAVPSSSGVPIAALGLRGPTEQLVSDAHSLAHLLHREATRLERGVAVPPADHELC
jgi:DNA-binding IclR family transcriptional regulator